MTRRPPHEDERQFALWHSKRTPGEVDSQGVVVAHADISVGESVALLLRLKGFVAVSTSTMENFTLMLEYWKPRAVLIDTRLCHADDFRFVREAAQDDEFRSVLMIAMTKAFPEETPHDMKQIGFDGLCRRPCPVWKLADMLDGVFRRSPFAGCPLGEP
jgi:DNA-binding response OmpR family regulator